MNTLLEEIFLSRLISCLKELRGFCSDMDHEKEYRDSNLEKRLIRAHHLGLIHTPTPNT